MVSVRRAPGCLLSPLRPPGPRGDLSGPRQGGGPPSASGGGAEGDSACGVRMKREHGAVEEAGGTVHECTETLSAKLTLSLQCSTSRFLPLGSAHPEVNAHAPVLPILS